VPLVGEEAQDGAEEGADHLGPEVQEHVADRRLDGACDDALGVGRLEERPVRGEQAEGDGGVDVGPGLECGEDTGEHCETPSEVDEEPAAVEALVLGQHHVGDHAAAEQGQRRGSEDLGPERIGHQ
jgi:hypothetical protein